MIRRIMYFPILLILVEIIAVIGDKIGADYYPGTYDVFAYIGIPLLNCNTIGILRIYA